MFAQEPAQEIQPDANEDGNNEASGIDRQIIQSREEREAEEYENVKQVVIQGLQSKLDGIKYERISAYARILMAQARDPAITFESRGTLRYVLKRIRDGKINN